MERSRDWIVQAEGDLNHARLDLDHGFYDWACFSSQQAAEKAVKAALYRHGGEAWGHAVTDLLAELGRHVEVEDDLLDLAQELDKTYISSRYPDALPSGSPRTRYTRGEAERMVGYADRIVRLCQGLLSTP